MLKSKRHCTKSAAVKQELCSHTSKFFCLYLDLFKGFSNTSDFLARFVIIYKLITQAWWMILQLRVHTIHIT